jgi:hypothetical protein
MLSVIMLSYVMLNVIMLSVVMLSVVMLIVMAPHKNAKTLTKNKKLFFPKIVQNF